MTIEETKAFIARNQRVINIVKAAAERWERQRRALKALGIDPKRPYPPDPNRGQNGN